MFEQQRLFKFTHWTEITPLVGWYFEILAGKLLDSRLTNRTKTHSVEHSEFDPDLSHKRDKELYIEVKAASKGRDFKLQEKQCNNFLSCREAGFPYSKLWYALFTYGLRNVTKNCPTEKVLFQKISETVERLVVLDSEIIERIVSGFVVKIYDWKDPFYRFGQFHLNEFENGWKEKLLDIGLNPTDFLVVKKWVPEIKVLSYKTRSFKFLSITKEAGN